MSSDNYFVVRPHPKGGWSIVMGFASCDDEYEEGVRPTATSDDPQFHTREEAFDAALSEYSEYGVWA